MSLIPNPTKVPNGNLMAGSASVKCNENCDGCLCHEPIKILKLEGPFDEKGKLVEILNIDKKYEYKITKFNRKIKQDELNKLQWAIQFDGEKEYSHYSSFNGKKTLSINMAKLLKPKDKKNKINMRVYAYFKTPSNKVSIINLIEGQYPKLYVSTEKTGYTIQKLYGHPFADPFIGTYEPAVVVETYRAYLKFFKNGVTTDIIAFNVTRDAWYYLGEKADNAYLLNRTFEPKIAENNIYLTEESHFPPLAPDYIKGYTLLQNGSSTIQAEPLEKQTDINGKPIKDKRINNSEAHDIMLHIGGVYRVNAGLLGRQWLGGSLGCFAFIPENDIFPTAHAAKQASENDDYDDDSSNLHWLKVTDKINKLREKDIQKRFFIIINKRKAWVKTKTIDVKEILHE